MKGSLNELKELDKHLAETCELVKDSSHKGSKAYTKVYVVKGNPIYKRFRLFFDERDKTGSFRVQDYFPCIVGVCTFTAIQAIMMIEESIQSIVSLI